MDCSLLGFSVHGILQARILEWVAISFSSIIVILCLSFWRTAILFSSMAGPFYIPINNVQYLRFSHPYQHLLFLLYVFLLLSSRSCFYILNINPWSDIWFENIFSHFLGCLFTLLVVIFDAQKFLILMNPIHLLFCFYILFFFLIRGYYFYNIVMVFTIHQRESALGIHMSPPSWTRLPLSPHSTPLGCHRVLALGSLHFTSNSHWHSILHMVMYMFQCYSLFCCLCLWCQN